ncbi:membrane protein [Streptomyces caelestis]|uniref:Membrane protein n=2 Tax=Streptomyces TaxID=1883 RepID=A0A0M9XAF8_9ACTN|nr:MULTISPECIES: DUF4307 domain-containing protein [Streptomyces]KOT44139.1 membrane protein [Streptomyces caelestis]KOV24368.1 membrane protein [Streptomyces sp. XY152]
MSTSSTRPPEGRYGRSSDERADRTLKVVGAVLSVLMLGLIGWFGYYYVAQNEISAEMIGFDTAEDSVKVHLEVHKDAGATGYCTVRSQSEDGAEVGRADFRFDEDATRIDEVVTLRTTSRPTSAELVGCHAD